MKNANAGSGRETDPMTRGDILPVRLSCGFGGRRNNNNNNKEQGES